MEPVHPAAWPPQRLGPALLGFLVARLTQVLNPEFTFYPGGELSSATRLDFMYMLMLVLPVMFDVCSCLSILTLAVSSLHKILSIQLPSWTYIAPIKVKCNLLPRPPKPDRA